MDDGPAGPWTSAHWRRFGDRSRAW